MVEYISSSFMPIFILIVFLYAVYKKVDLYDAFIEGSKSGLKIIMHIFPFMLAMIFAVNILMDSGIVDFIGQGFSKLFPSVNLKPQLFSMFLLRPLSANAGTAILTNIYQTFTPDSYIGLTASVMMGSIDAAFYVMSLYYGNAGIKKIRYTLKAALIASAIGMTSAVIISFFLFK